MWTEFALEKRKIQLLGMLVWTRNTRLVIAMSWTRWLVCVLLAANFLVGLFATFSMMASLSGIGVASAQLWAYYLWVKLSAFCAARANVTVR
jgi:hypothetical protein